MTERGKAMVSDLWRAFLADGQLSSATFRQRTAGSVTSTSITSGVLSGASTTSTAIQVLLSNFREVEIDGVRVVRGDRRVRFPIDSVSMVPDNDDQFVIGSKTYRIVDKMTPTDGATYNLHIRES